MHFIKTCIRMVAAGSILLALHSCSEKEVAPPQATTVPVKKPFPDLSLSDSKKSRKKTGRSDCPYSESTTKTFQTLQKF